MGLHENEKGSVWDNFYGKLTEIEQYHNAVGSGQEPVHATEN